jgi:lipopolysaccharide/colanic/teichoic acid biosynthesis glycosyltransferase
MVNDPISRATEKQKVFVRTEAVRKPSSVYLASKRILDIIISSVAIALLSPLLIPVVIALLLTGEGYVFYTQKRIGLANQYFNVLKFATMLKDSPNMGSGLITLRNDPRVTPVGKILRMTKINELPQVFNVLLGNMSIVGPRPLVDKTFNAYPKNVQSRVYHCKPGITGIGSIVFRDEEALMSMTSIPPQEFYQKIIAPYKGELELWYQEHQTFWVDLVIIFLTGWAVLFPKSQLVFRIFNDLPRRKLLV